jgi:predicted nucleotidyltransferase component of viral defense system
MIPLILRLKKTSHREIARAQDIMIESLYEVFENAVFHGGTCIWRCFNGNRFSEDIDVYIPKDRDKINQFFEILEKKGLTIERKKISEQSIFSTLKFNRTIVRFEAIFKKSEGHLKDYETAEGNFLAVYSLNQEELIIEKVATYLKRFKIRDLYDIYFLLRYVDDISSVRKFLTELLDKFKKPIDEKDLKVIILEGIVPMTTQMINYIQGRLKDGQVQVQTKN